MEQHEELTMNTTPAFADNLAQLRATHNMTQEQLAERLGVSRQSVSKLGVRRLLAGACHAGCPVQPV